MRLVRCKRLWSQPSVFQDAKERNLLRKCGIRRADFKQSLPYCYNIVVFLHAFLECNIKYHEENHAIT